MNTKYYLLVFCLAVCFLKLLRVELVDFDDYLKRSCAHHGFDNKRRIKYSNHDRSTRAQFVSSVDLHHIIIVAKSWPRFISYILVPERDSFSYCDDFTVRSLDT